MPLASKQAIALLGGVGRTRGFIGLDHSGMHSDLPTSKWTRSRRCRVTPVRVSEKTTYESLKTSCRIIRGHRRQVHPCLEASTLRHPGCCLCRALATTLGRRLAERAARRPMLALRIAPRILQGVRLNVVDSTPMAVLFSGRHEDDDLFC
jgi:hypothetical protein